ncbi:MAG: SpaA isopeptide-forming pilin-related protein, partial [Buchananella hordeovulneris]|nr:SpaA isopeptide-forming pilin-related protein [Buchananella hordeovulneris]
TQGQTVEVGEWENTPITGTVTVTKVDADNAAKKLAGVVFALRQGGVNVYRATTAADGVATFSGVRYGTYELVEVSALENYVLDDTYKATVRISSQGQSMDVGSVPNAVKRADVVAVKKSEDGAALAGAVFELRQDGKVLGSATSLEDGSVTFRAVPWGKYQLVEVKAPAGYKLNTAQIAVRVRQNGGQVTVGEIVNAKETAPIATPTPSGLPSVSVSPSPQVSVTPSGLPSVSVTPTPNVTPTPPDALTPDQPTVTPPPAEPSLPSHPSVTPPPVQPSEPSITSPPAEPPQPSAPSDATPAPTPGRTGKLAKTGSDAPQALPWALALVTGGLLLLVARKRRG